MYESLMAENVTGAAARTNAAMRLARGGQSQSATQAAEPTDA